MLAKCQFRTSTNYWTIGGRSVSWEWKAQTPRLPPTFATCSVSSRSTKRAQIWPLWPTLKKDSKRSKVSIRKFSTNMWSAIFKWLSKLRKNLSLKQCWLFLTIVSKTWECNSPMQNARKWSVSWNSWEWIRIKGCTRNSPLLTLWWPHSYWLLHCPSFKPFGKPWTSASARWFPCTGSRSSAGPSTIISGCQKTTKKY